MGEWTSARTRRIRGPLLEGRVVIRDCGCWIIRAYGSELILRFQGCAAHCSAALDRIEKMLYLDKVGSVSAPEEEEDQLWLT